MACLRDLQHLFHPRQAQPSNPFYAGFGNRITDALSYRSVGIPSSRIFTINSNAEVHILWLLNLMARFVWSCWNWQGIRVVIFI